MKAAVTKSKPRGAKPRVSTAGPPPGPARKAPALEEEKGWRLPPLFWNLAAPAVLAGAALLRLAYLTLCPLHHDEGVNGLFMTTLFRTGYYQYNPANYHGPSLYYFGLVTSTLNSFIYGKAGLSTFSVRLVPAVFGMATVGLILCLRRKIGNFGATAAAGLMAVSTGNVYFSRYFIHEVPLVFFTLGLVMAAVWWQETRRPRHAMLASASAALIFTTKETSIITFAVLALAYLCTLGYMRWRGPDTPPDLPKTAEPAAPAKRIAIFKDRKNAAVLAYAVLLFVAISVVLYSSFFSNFPQGVYDSVRTFTVWGKTGTSQYLAPWTTYFQWLINKEAPILMLGATGIVIALWQAGNRFAVFTAFWAMGMTAAYSLVPYKTPWLTLNLILPLALAAGYGLDQWYELGAQKRSPHARTRPQGPWYFALWVLLNLGIFLAVVEVSDVQGAGEHSRRLWYFALWLSLCLVLSLAISDFPGVRERLRRMWHLSLGVAMAAIVWCCYQAIDLSFSRYDDNDQTYVYAHTVRDFESLIHEIERISAQDGLGTKMGVVVMSPDYWPMPWYLRDYPNTGYWGKVIETKEPVVIAKDSQEDEVKKALGDNYVYFNTYTLRPGNHLMLYLRRDQRP